MFDGSSGYPFVGSDEGNGQTSSWQNMFDPGYDSGNGWQKAWGLLDPGGSSLFSMFQNKKSQDTNPSDAAMGYYNKIPDMLKSIYEPYMNAGNSAVQPFLQNAQGVTNPFLQKGTNAVDPYMQGGQWAAGNLQTQTNNLVNNPAGVMNSIGSSFKQSPGYAWQTQQAQQAVNNAAAAGGMAGSPLQQQNSANVVNQLANQDYYNYLDHGMSMYNQGYQGLQNMYGTGAGMANNMYGNAANIANNMYGIGGNIANNMYGAGANAANQYGENLASTMMNQGNLAYLGQINKNQQHGSQMAGLGSLLGGLGGMFGGGGGGSGGSGGGDSSNMMGSLMQLAPLLMMFM